MRQRGHLVIVTEFEGWKEGPRDSRPLSLIAEVKPSKSWDRWGQKGAPKWGYIIPRLLNLTAEFQLSFPVPTPRP